MYDDSICRREAEVRMIASTNASIRIRAWRGQKQPNVPREDYP